MILKGSNKSVWSNVFWYIKVYSESLFNTLYNEIKYKYEKIFPSNKINVANNALFCLSQVPTHHNFTSNS